MSANRPSPKFGWIQEEAQKHSEPEIELFDISIITGKTPDVQVVKDEVDRVIEAFQALNDAIVEQRELLELLAKLEEWESQANPQYVQTVIVGDTLPPQGNQWISDNTSQWDSLTNYHDHSYSHSHSIVSQEVPSHSHGAMVAMSYATTANNEARVQDILNGTHKPLTSF